MPDQRTDEEIRNLISRKLHMGFGDDLISGVAISKARQLLEQDGDFAIQYRVGGQLLSAEDFQSDPYYGAPFHDSGIEIVSA